MSHCCPQLLSRPPHDPALLDAWIPMREGGTHKHRAGAPALKHLPRVSFPAGTLRQLPSILDALAGFLTPLPSRPPHHLPTSPHPTPARAGRPPPRCSIAPLQSPRLFLPQLQSVFGPPPSCCGLAVALRSHLGRTSSTFYASTLTTRAGSRKTWTPLPHARLEARALPRPVGLSSALQQWVAYRLQVSSRL